jgi:anti-sigma factor RsiW
MSCDDLKILWPEFLTGELAPKSKAALEAHLAGCPSCAAELHKTTEMWTKLGVLAPEQPSPAVRERFYTMLEAYKQGLEATGTAPAAAERRPARKLDLGAWFSWRRPSFRFAAAAAFLLAGIGFGTILGPAGPFGSKLARLESQVDAMRQTTALSLLDQPSSSERLLGVSYSEQVSAPEATTIDALLRTLDTDPSVNVRLAAVDALFLFAKEPAVRDGLVASLGRQTNPVIQVALIDLLQEIREKKAVEALKSLIGNDRIRPEVQKRAEAGLKSLTSRG